MVITTCKINMLVSSVASKKRTRSVEAPACVKILSLVGTFLAISVEVLSESRDCLRDATCQPAK